jgi:hypothetical protein
MGTRITELFHRALIGKTLIGRTLIGTLIAAACGAGSAAFAGITIAPYASIKSTKGIAPAGAGSETSDLDERQEYGLRGALTFYSLFSLELSAGQSVKTTTTKVQDAADEYGQINFQKDLNMSTDDPNTSLKITETQKDARFSVTLDPSFSIFILRARAGVQATERIIKSEPAGQPSTTITTGPTYKPVSGFGFGIRPSPSMYFMAEYNMYHYAFPKLEPFEREVAVTYAVSL